MDEFWWEEEIGGWMGGRGWVDEGRDGGDEVVCTYPTNDIIGERETTREMI